MTQTDDQFARDITTIQSIAQVPRILEACCSLTGMGFAAIARVTDDRWVTCASLDHVAFGLAPGAELPVNSTICDEIRDSRRHVVFDDAQADPHWTRHHTPRLYGLRSYLSVPIILRDGSFFGTLCAIDSAPRAVDRAHIVAAFELFADLIAAQVSDRLALAASERALLDARAQGQLREQFIAVLGHDLRNPLAALKAGLRMLGRPTADLPMLLPEMHRTTDRMAAIIENLLDFARARLGDGLRPQLRQPTELVTLARAILSEVEATSGRQIELLAPLPVTLACDASQIGRLMSNLLGNAVLHGAPHSPVQLVIRTIESPPESGTDGATEDGIEDGIEIAVRNAGPAIPPARQAALFEPFVRGADPAGSGLGLGLYISAQIARAHGGTLRVVSGDDATEFSCRLPLIS